VRGIRQGQLTWEEGEVPGKVEPVGTHRGGGATMGRRGRIETAAFRWRVAPVIIDECGEVLQLEGDKGVRKWQLIEETRGSRRRSPTNGGWWRGSVKSHVGQHPPVVGGG
jgi:hypothetical protein